MPNLSFFQTPSSSGWGARAAPSAGAAGTARVAGEQDIEVVPGPTDTVSAVAFSPTADVLAVASWDSYVRIYRIDKTQAQPVQPHQQYQHEGPVLDVCFNSEGNKVVSGGADKVARCFDLNTNQTAVVAQHNDTIRCVRWLRAFGGALVTGSWDRTVKLWKIDPQPTLITSLDVPERVYAMDTIGLVIIVATAERKIVAFQCNEATGTAAQVAAMDSPLKYQTRSLAALPEGDGFALGGTEGRVGVNYFHDPPDPKDGRMYVCCCFGLTQEKVRFPLPPPCKCGPSRCTEERDAAVPGQCHRVQFPGHVRYRWRRWVDQFLVQGQPHTSER